MIFGFLNVGERARIIQKWIEDPAEEAYVLARTMFINYIRSYLIVGGFALAAFAVFGFSALGGGPFVLAEIFFYITLVFLLFFSFIMWFIWRKVHSYIHKMSEEYKKKVARVVDYEDVGPLKEIE